MSKNINCRLPPEVLRGIFFYLEDSQRLEAALVCQHWLSLLNCRSLLKGIFLHIQKSNFERHFHDLLTPTRWFAYVEFARVALNKNFLQFIEAYCDFIHSLSFRCGFDKDLFTGETITLDKLKYLKISFPIEVLQLFSSLSNLEHLVIHNIGNVAVKSENVKRLQNIVLPKLKRITYQYGEINVSFFKSLITQYSKSLEVLDFDNLPQSAASTISSIPGLKLKKLRFPPNCEPSVAVEICRMQPSLTSLVAYDVSFEKSHWEEILHLLPHLQIISLSHCNIPDLSLVLGLKQLKEFTVKYCNYNELKAIPFTQLRKFECWQICPPSFLMQLLPQMIYIQVLTLQYSVTDKVMWMISGTLTNLKFLCLRHCDTLTDTGLSAQILPGEERESATPISNLRGLTTLVLHGLPKITDVGVEEAIQFPFLVKLSLRSCKGITEQIKPVLLERNPCLRKCEFP